MSVCASSRWLCQTSCSHLTIPNETGMSHGAALGTATQKTIMKGGAVILMTQEISLFGFDGFYNVVCGCSIFNSNRSQVQSPHKQPPSKALTSVRASREQYSPNPAIPHPVRRITPLSRAPRAYGAPQLPTATDTA